ncbi:MAG: GNAT family N-acetyltransferase [Bacteroidota bacterium]
MIPGNSNNYKIIVARSEEDFNIARSLFLQYEKEINIDLCFQDFENEINNLHDQYGPPGGLILLLKHEKDYIGCCGLRKLKKNYGEIKRLYIVKDHRGKGLSRILMKDIIRKAKQVKYKYLRLDTLSSMKEAIGLYTSLEFKEIEAYRFNPEEGAKFFELLC